MKRLYEFPCLFLFRGILRRVVLRIQVVELNRNIKTEVVGVLIIRKEKTVPTYSTVVKFVDIFKVEVIDRLPEKTSRSN